MTLATLDQEKTIIFGSNRHLVKEGPTDYTAKKVDTNKSETYTKHDLLFKQLINNFFEEFIEAFFPDVHEHVGFTEIKPMSEEVHSDFIDGSTKQIRYCYRNEAKGRGRGNYHSRRTTKFCTI